MKAIEILCLSIRRNEPEIYDGRESLQLLALLQYFADALNQRQDERSKEKELMYLSSLLQNPRLLQDPFRHQSRGLSRVNGGRYSVVDGNNRLSVVDAFGWQLILDDLLILPRLRRNIICARFNIRRLMAEKSICQILGGYQPGNTVSKRLRAQQEVNKPHDNTYYQRSSGRVPVKHIVVNAEDVPEDFAANRDLARVRVRSKEIVLVPEETGNRTITRRQPDTDVLTKLYRILMTFTYEIFKKAPSSTASRCSYLRIDPTSVEELAMDVDNYDYWFRQSELHKIFNSVWQTSVSAGNCPDPDTSILDRKSTRLNSSHSGESRMPSSA